MAIFQEPSSLVLPLLVFPKFVLCIFTNDTVLVRTISQMCLYA